MSILRGKAILLVEGTEDVNFLKTVCSVEHLEAVEVWAPRGLGGNYNSKEGVLNFLPMLMLQFADGSLERLAVVVDADSPQYHGLGYQRTRNRFVEVFESYGFQCATERDDNGIIFTSDDGLPNIGLWIMPDNGSNGVLEDFVERCVDEAERPLLNLANNAIDALTSPKFVPAHRVKALMATWLAWQRKPGRGLGFALEENLISKNSDSYKQLAQWLHETLD